ncbi:uncharacterized protein PV07_08427 [Cladophialophora immunda]|uniref:Carboxylesterase type B domain-containing protein n=1 Tax=Cladophialophora immunda TaxID=569365 RepID=A0A0D1ZBW1_9EURO|nr:uncharacterized protein PV07_08427 [Cladophialophora immunda]KIW25231.1 hypothetical protein PV07_08427 [Cladophialophora immunda]OQV00284.1 hypothetical protein CLAIMM_05802 [Cladophialophora immunda]
MKEFRLLLTIFQAACLFSTRSQAVPTKAKDGKTQPSSSINTTSGRYIGSPSKTHPDVLEYIGIRYALPPVKDLRFAPPVAFVSNQVFNASTQPPDCPYVVHNWGAVPGELYSHAGRIMSEESADAYNIMSEDCLYLNLWTKSSGNSKKKPVLVFVYGGGFERGSVNNPTYNGVYFAEQEDLVVVSFNYRVNIFGFSGAPGAGTNLALRDCRLALEWVRDNIEAFGGDPTRITMFGQSQGAWIISWYAYAFPNDPIAQAFIQESGSAFADLSSTEEERAAIWRNASASIGCDQASDPVRLECMRNQSVSTVLGAMLSIPQQGVAPTFGPLIDEELVFSNYTARTLSRDFAQKPFLMGSNDNEAGFYVMRYAGNNQITLSATQQETISYGEFVCPIAADAAVKRAIASESVPVWRYEYFGNWPNLRLYPGSGAYHTSEVSMVFGTSADLTGEPNTPLQEIVSRYMRHAWATFARDPMNGLREQLGWPVYNNTGDTLVRLGYGNETKASFVSPAEYDAPCSALV